ncbi:MAG: bifunctional diaminohydroxyphosphoribosylaminopyrimidine deaminase/5-amino-6-(5-phosphoribosylamino)uracil reductase RibD [Candidatus Omnitrophota bacterium]
MKRFIRMAISLAEGARGETFPNPLVGAVVVRNGRVVGRGFHKKAGGPHAEIYALKEAGRQARGASLYCTFEPCSHYGRTGPCVDEIILAGIKKVYCGIIDPDPITSGRGVRALREAGIKTSVGFFEDEIRRLNEPFIKAVTKGMPFVTVKIAESLDGKTATHKGESQWITSESSRQYAHLIRRFYDCIMVGINTVLKDDPRLEPSERFKGHKLIKIVVDSRLRIPLQARLLNTCQPVIVACVKNDILKEKKLRQRGVLVIHTKSKKGRVDIRELLEKLERLEIRNVLVEGGSALIGSFLDGHLADKALFFIAPSIIGGTNSMPAVGGEGVKKLSSAIRLKNLIIKRMGEDILVEGDIAYSVERSAIRKDFTLRSALTAKR